MYRCYSPVSLLAAASGVGPHYSNEDLRDEARNLIHRDILSEDAHVWLRRFIEQPDLVLQTEHFQVHTAGVERGGANAR